MTARQEEYREYLKTDYWKKVSLEVKARANFRCQVCNSPNQLNAHHRTYANKGNELEHLDDLTCLCKQCHSLYHGKPVNAAPQGPAVAGDTVWTKPSKKKSKKNKGYLMPSLSLEERTMRAIRDMPKGTGDITITRKLLRLLKTKKWITGETAKALGVDMRISGWRKRMAGQIVTREAFFNGLIGRGKFAAH